MKGSCFISGKIWSFSFPHSLDFLWNLQLVCVSAGFFFFGVSMETIILCIKLLPLSLLLEENKKELRKYLKNLIRKKGIPYTERHISLKWFLFLFCSTTYSQEVTICRCPKFSQPSQDCFRNISLCYCISMYTDLIFPHIYLTAFPEK